MRRTLFATCLVLAFGAAVLWWATSGLRAFTAETARRIAVLASPEPIPDVELVDGSGRSIRLSDYTGQAVIVDFIYTQCPTICVSLGDNFGRLQERIKADGVPAKLLSISFDLAQDGPRELSEYARVHGADASIWKLARPRNAGELRLLLEAYAVIVLPDGIGGFVHNAALHVVGPDGKLTGIYDLDQHNAAFLALRSFIK
ncbi:SCO family protein [Bradyrhizobium sp. AUGA SZCCT0176]|uniref:SCO family protein n=1 Tax=unclassified Bradyrhizobium TaxID=2631580 RepID=UPI001BAA97C3|nr:MULTISPECIES: SCO family protein [unclassified Bradyrhizobium]MBR1225122.1 SCO family protein [Bradyrhizobium sp. AUGA SZCCT0176]MBR1281545.1 SCO family protein [Bradyrhizobium sp. AUGA SZCCT0177]